jgi:signal peptidase I
MSASSAVSPARVEPSRPAAVQSAPRANYISEKIRTNGSACFRVLGQSMFPWIRSGDFVFVRRCPFEAASVGQVILYERERRLFVHRVIRRLANNSTGPSGLLLVTKGDALDGKDAPVNESEFLGRIIRIHRGRRHVDMEFLGRVLFGKILALFSPASFLLYRPLRGMKHFLFP